jgi:hypothetical protein
MDNSHSKEIVLGRTTVKIPGGRPRGSEAPRTCPKTSANGHLIGPEALSAGNRFKLSVSANRCAIQR